MAMVGRWRLSSMAFGVVVVLVSCSGPVGPEGFLASGLCSPSARNSLRLNGAAVFEDLGGGACALRLTPSTTLVAGSAFSVRPVALGLDGAFAISFSFTMDEHAWGGADGIAFVLQGDSSAALGDAGSGIGYVGIEPSIIIEFDTYRNDSAPEHDPDANHVGINVNGDPRSVATFTPTFDLASGERRYAWVDYDGATLEVRVSDAAERPAVASLLFEVDIVETLGANEAYVGLTAATGAASSRHRIRSAVFSTTR